MSFPFKPPTFSFDGTKVTTFRGELGMSQHHFAASLGVPQSTVSRWETGRTTPSAGHLGTMYHVGKSAGVIPNFFDEK